MEYVSNEPSQIQIESLLLHILPHSNAVGVHEFVQILELDLKKSKQHYLKYYLNNLYGCFPMCIEIRKCMSLKG